MYLKARKYVSGYAFDNEDQKPYKNCLKAIGLSTKDVSEDSPSLNVTVNVAYWRKSNHIHSWFVTNVQDGVDECQESLVDREQLTELLEICKRVAADHSLAEELLEPKGGFFFGSTEIDEWYFSDLDNTIAMLEKVLNNPKFEHCDFYYQSSW